MLNDIVAGIALSIRGEFGTDSKIYMNDVEQGLSPPCFFVSALKPELSPIIGARYMSRNSFVVQYFPADRKDNADMNNTAERMADVLEFINPPAAGHPLHGTGMSWEITDGVLSFFVNYNLPLRRQIAHDHMETAEIDVGTEGEI